MISDEQAPVAPVSVELKTHTTDHHHRAERSAFQQDLVKGRVTRREYADWLAQLLSVFRVLEASWNSAGLESRFPELSVGSWGRSAALESDLHDLGVGPEASRAGEATTRFVSYLRRLGEERPTGLLGVVYVLEGSTNGSVYIARAIRKGLGLAGNTATAYLDPYGQEQRAKWAVFKVALDRIDPVDLPIMIEAARATFDAMTGLGEGIRQPA